MGRPIRTKRLLNTKAVHIVLSLLFSLVMRVLYATARVRKTHPDSTDPYANGERPAIYCFWHGRMIMQPFVKPPGRPMYVLISHHNDGALITATMRWFGIDSVRGSRKRGSKEAIANLLRVTQEGGNIAITPDGPRGPFQKAAQGAAYVAARTGYPLVPVTFSVTRHWRLKSWDKFMIPKPFARIDFIYNQPFYVTGDSDEEIAAATAQLEASLTRITAEADMLCGVTP